MPANKGLVYIYYQPDHQEWGELPILTANGKPIARINTGGFFPYVSAPGIVHFVVRRGTEVIKEADVTVEAGTEKYLKVSFGLDSLFYHWKFSEVSPEIGSKEITKCRLLKPIQP
jgi:hypothetical protein